MKDAFAEARKHEEVRVYDELYAARQVNASPSLRSVLLREVEDSFQDRVREICRGKKVLEIGFGDGAPSILAAQSGAQVTAVDISPQAVEFAKERAKMAGVSTQIEFLVMDVEALTFADGTFDVIIDNEVFSSLDLPVAIPELKRVLRVGGVLLGKETYGHNPIFNLKRRLNVLRGRRTDWAAAHVLREEDFALLAADFDVVSLKYFHLFVLGLAPVHFLGLRSITRRLVALTEALDRRVLAARQFRNLAFKVLFELRKKG